MRKDDNRHQSSQEIVYEKKIFKVRNSYKIKISSYVKLKLRNQIIELLYFSHYFQNVVMYNSQYI